MALYLGTGNKQKANLLIYDQYDEGYADGKNAENSAFWNCLQNYGRRDDYSYAFYWWDTDYFTPKYNIYGDNFQYAFCNMGRQGKHSRLDLTARLEECGVTLNTSKSLSFNYAFFNSCIERIPGIDTTKSATLQYVFGFCDYLHTIDKLILKSDGSQSFYNPIGTCKALENLTIEGVIGKSGFLLNNSPKLTHDSLMSVINALKDYSEDTSGSTYKITLGSTNIAKLTTDEIAMIEAKGWTYA